MGVAAVEFTAGWGAVTTLVGTIGGVIVSGALNAWSERTRARLAVEQRRDDRRAEHQTRLFEARQATYADLRRRYLEYRRLGDTAVAAAEERLSYRQGRSPSRTADTDAEGGASLRLDAADAARRRFEDSLADAEGKASSPVQAAIDTLRDGLAATTAVHAALRARLGGATRIPEVDGDAVRRLDEAEAALRRAIRVELGLDAPGPSYDGAGQP
jgi:hypothetical protein